MNRNSKRAALRELDLVETGGTIDMVGYDSRRPLGNLGALIKALEFFVSVRVHRPIDPPVDSSNIGPAELKKILATVSSLCEKRINRYGGAVHEEHAEAITGIVITHGTDTLQETALVLALELGGTNLTFPVILTCAYVPPTEPHSDALRNLVLAAVAAQSFRLSSSSSHVIPPGVYVVVGNDLHLASRIKKVTTRPIHNRSYVESYPAPAGQLTITHKANLWELDVENEVRCRIHKDLCPPRRRMRTRPLVGERDFGYVEHLWFKKDSPVEILERSLARCHHQAVQSGRGVALVQHGDFSKKSEKEFQQLIEVIRRFRRGTVQVPVFSGSPSVVTKINSAGTRKLVFLIPKSLSHAKARTKLAWLLRSNISPSQLSRLLNHDIAGECFEVAMLPDWIAGESYGPNNHQDAQFSKRVLIVFPGIDSSVYVEAVDSLVNTNTRKRELNIIGLGDGNVPLGSITVAETVSRYLTERYGLDLNLSAPTIYLDAESELAANLRYNRSLREVIASEYVITNRREMSREILSWFIKEREKAEQLRVERKVGILASLLAKELGLSEVGVRRIVDGGHGGRALFMALSKRSDERSALVGLTEVLRGHGLSTEGLASGLPTEFKDMGGLLVQDLDDWLKKVESDSKQLALLVRALASVYARRIMKDAIAVGHPVLSEIVKCVDLGVRVNIKSNAEMARTDTRTYELGNFLLVAGVNSAEWRGWAAGPLRLKVAKQNSTNLTPCVTEIELNSQT